MAELTPAQEQQLVAFIEQMYATWLPAVEGAALGGYTRFGIRPDVAAVASTEALWRQQVRALEVQLQEVAAQAYREEDPQGAINYSDAAAVAAAAATLFFLMAQVTEVQGTLATIVASAASLAAAVAAIRAYLSPANPHWAAKARQLSQTEGDRWAQMATLLAAFALQRRDGVPWEKEWVSRDDDRVRPAHALADGQVRSVGAPFQVGGFPMMYPKDPAAPPELVVNCRCSMAIRRMEVRRGRLP